MVAYGPDGTLYVAADELANIICTPTSLPPPVTTCFPGASGLPAVDFSHSGVGITMGAKGQENFAPPQVTGSPEDRPWLTVDQTTGTVYTVSAGTFDAATGALDTGVGIADRLLVAWKKDLSVKSGL